MSLHYKTKEGIEVIDVVKAYKLNFNRGNIIKYICRASNKGTEILDLEKALDYLQHEINHLRKKQEEIIENYK